MTAAFIVTIALMAGASTSPCGPEYMPTYPGAHVREALFTDVVLNQEQCEEMERVTREFLEYLRSINADWAIRPLDERRRKMRQLYCQHADTLIEVGTAAQRVTLERNMRRVRELLTSPEGDGGVQACSTG